MKFQNTTFQQCICDADDLSFSEQTQLINRYPEAKKVFCGLILLIQEEKRNHANVNDWECDLANIVWPVIQKRM